MRAFALVIALALPTTAQAQDITTGLVHHWKLDDTNTTAIDETGNANGIMSSGLSGTTHSVKGVLENAIRLDGSQYITTASNSVNHLAGTTAAWVYTSDAGVIIQGSLNPNRIYMETNSSGNLRIRLNTTAIDTSTPIPSNVWTHVAMTWDNGNYAGYVNGVQTDSGTYALLTGKNSCPALGAFVQSCTSVSLANSNLEGYIDDARIYNRALTPADINALYQHRFDPFTGPMTCNADYAGVLIYNEDESVMQYCDGSDWLSMGQNATSSGGDDPCKYDDTAIGTLCADNTIYAGPSSDGEAPMFMIPCSEGRTWNGSSCSGSPSSIGWKFSPYTTTGATRQDDGDWNTATAYAAGTNNYAVARCATNSYADYDDWYLPARTELIRIYNNKASLPTLHGNRHWSSTETSQTGAFELNLGTGASNYFSTKNGLFSVLCVRQGSFAERCAPAGKIIFNADNSVMQYCNGTEWISMGPKDAGMIAPATGLLHHWKLDAGSGTTALDSIGTSTGTLVNTPTWGTGTSGSALTFNGSSQFIYTSANSTTYQKGTLSAWVKPSTAGNSTATMLMASDTPNRIYLLNIAGNLGTRLGSSASIDSGDRLPLNSWAHIALSWDNGNYKTYLNGTEVDSGTYTGLNGVTNCPVIAGYYNGCTTGGSTGGLFSGSIDDVRIYDRALTASEMETLYNATGGTKVDPLANILLAHWKLDETSGSVINDETGASPATWGDNGDNAITPSIDSVSGPRNTALDFISTKGSVINAGSPSHLDNMFAGGGTITLWVYPRGSGQGTSGRIFTKGLGNEIYNDLWYTDTNKFVFAHRFGNNPKHWASEVSPLNQWVHLAIVYNSDSVSNTPTIYLNGVQSALTTWGSTSGSHDSDASYNFRLGNNSDKSRGANALIDDVRVYDQPLSAADVAEIYNSTSNECKNPNGTAGEMVFNADHSLMQYCNGINWVSMSPGPPPPPPACSPNCGGDTDKKLVFVTSTTYDGNDFGSVAGADAACQARATAGGLAGTYKAWIADSNPASAPATRFTQATVPYVTPMGTEIASNWAALTSGANLTNSLRDNEFAVTETGSDSIWTNVNQNGTQQGSANASHCTNWTSTAGTATTGRKISTNSSWTVYATASADCSTPRRLYCFEQGSADTTPDAFTFTDKTDVAVSTLTSSNIVPITGINTGATVSIAGTGSPEFRICSDAACSSVVQTWGSSAQTITNNQYLQLRLTSSATNATALAANVTVGGVTDQWDVTTLAGPTPGAFVVVIDSTLGADGTSATEVMIPTGTGTFNYDIAWDDGSNSGTATGLTGDHTLTGVSGPVTIEITGTFPHFGGDIVDHGVVDVVQWGTNPWQSMEDSLRNETNLTGFTATDAPDLSAVTDISFMFYNTDFNDDISHWDLSNITDTSSMFRLAEFFNQDISGWDVSNVRYMGNMFRDANAFNQDISGWDVSNVTNMARMFGNANVFNQDISGWDVSNVTNMDLMFQNATAFNQDLSPWCVTNIGSEPTDFATGASSWSGGAATRPQWGTCP